jgi:hypothetical protein
MVVIDFIEQHNTIQFNTIQFSSIHARGDILLANTANTILTAAATPKNNPLNSRKIEARKVGTAMDTASRWGPSLRTFTSLGICSQECGVMSGRGVRAMRH